MINFNLTAYSALTSSLRRFCLSLFVLAGLTGNVRAQDLDNLHQHASEAMQQGNYAVAFCIWQPLAQAGEWNEIDGLMTKINQNAIALMR